MTQNYGYPDNPDTFVPSYCLQLTAVPKIIYASSKSSELFLEKLRQGTGQDPAVDCFEVRLEKALSFNTDAVCPHIYLNHSI